MSRLEVHKAFATSDAYKATQAKELEAERMYNEDLTAMGVDISKPFTLILRVLSNKTEEFLLTLVSLV